MGASSSDRGDDAANINLVNLDGLAMRSTAATGRCDDDASKRDATTCSVEYARVGKNMDGRWTNGWQVHNSIDACVESMRIATAHDLAQAEAAAEVTERLRTALGRLLKLENGDDAGGWDCVICAMAANKKEKVSKLWEKSYGYYN